MRSIRSHLLGRLIAGSACVLGAAGLAVYLVVSHSLRQQFDRNLAQRVQGLASLLFQTEKGVEFAFSDQLMPEYSRAERPIYFELTLADGRVLERSESLRTAMLTLAVEPDESPRTWSALLPDGREGRFVAQMVDVHHVFPEEGPLRPQAARLRIVVASGREDLLETERTVLVSSGAALLVLVGLIALITWRVVESGLAPAGRLAGALAALRVERLPSALDAGPLPVELRPMAEKATELMRRVEHALERERRTTADIAHELRTPLAEILTSAEVALRCEHTQADAQALRTVRDVASRLGVTVTTLLKLARLEMGSESFARAEIGLEALLEDVLRPLAALVRDRGLLVELRVPGGASVEADPDALRIVLANLLCNACTYAPRASTVEVSWEACSQGWRLSVENVAPGLQPADLELLAEPFWRKDSARADRDRSGLGLALSRALAEKCGLELRFELERETFRALLLGRAGHITRA